MAMEYRLSNTREDATILTLPFSFGFGEALTVNSILGKRTSIKVGMFHGFIDACV